MKKLILSLSLVVGLTTAHADSVTMTVTSGAMSNLLSSFKGSAVVTSLILTAPAANTASISLIDSVTNILAYTNAAYSTLSSYATNLITSYTNFFGTTQSLTNLVLVDYSNYVAAATVNYPTKAAVTASTNSTVTINPTSFFFNNGLWVTNTGSGNATVTVSFRQ